MANIHLHHLSSILNTTCNLSFQWVMLSSLVVKLLKFAFATLRAGNMASWLCGVCAQGGSHCKALWRSWGWLSAQKISEMDPCDKLLFKRKEGETFCFARPVAGNQGTPSPLRLWAVWAGDYCPDAHRCIEGILPLARVPSDVLYVQS